MSSENDLWKIYIVSHGPYFEAMYQADSDYSPTNYSILHVGSNEPNYPKLVAVEVVNELECFSPLGKSWAESEAIYNIWKSGMFKNFKFIGFIQYDFELKTVRNLPKLNLLKNSTEISSTITGLLDENQICRIHISFANFSMQNELSKKMLVDFNRPRVLYGLIGSKAFKLILKDYNEYFSTKYRLKDLPLEINLCSAFLIDIQTFDEMMTFFEWILRKRDWNLLDPTGSHRVQGGIAERYFGVYLAMNKEIIRHDLSLHHHDLKENKGSMPGNSSLGSRIINFLRYTLSI